jgi:hypothetical protein
LPDLKAVRPDVAGVFSQVLQDTLRRLDKTYQAFFTRIQRGQKAGFPRFKGRHRYDSFTYPQSGFALAAKLQPSKIGNLKIKQHRDMEGEITCRCAFCNSRIAYDGAAISYSGGFQPYIDGDDVALCGSLVGSCWTEKHAYQHAASRRMAKTFSTSCQPN